MNNRLPLLKLPDELLEALRQGNIAYTKAKAISGVKDAAARKQLLENAPREADLGEIANSLQLWQDPKKKKKLESLLSQLEKLIQS